MAVSELLISENYHLSLHYNSNKENLIKLLKKNSNKKINLIKQNLSSEINAKNLIKSFKKNKNYYAIVICLGILKYSDYTKVNHKLIEKHIFLNSLIPFYLTRNFIANQKKKLKVIFLSSISPKYYGSKKSLHYAASKAAMDNLLMGIGKHSKKNIIINGIRCGLIDSEMMKSKGKEEIKKRVQLIPLGRYGKPHEIAHAVSFLISDKASYINNTILDVTGGD